MSSSCFYSFISFTSWLFIVISPCLIPPPTCSLFTHTSIHIPTYLVPGSRGTLSGGAGRRGRPAPGQVLRQTDGRGAVGLRGHAAEEDQERARQSRR